MIEKTITIDSIEPVEIYGVNDVKLNVIKKFFPKLKIVARGYSIKVDKLFKNELSNYTPK